jgi:hypothetical protein
MVQKCVWTGATTVLAPPQLILEALVTHNFAPICDFSGSKNNPSNTPPVRDYSIRAEKLARYIGVDSPLVVYPFGRICDSELFSHVFQSANQSHLTKFLSWRIYLVAHTPKNCRSEFICQDFQSPKLISHTPTERPDFTVALRKIRSFLKNLVYQFLSLDPKPARTVSKTHV